MAHGGAFDFLLSLPEHLTIMTDMCKLVSCRKDDCDIVDDEEVAALMRSIESSLLGAAAASDDDVSDRACLTDHESNASDIDELSELGIGPASTSEQAADWEHVPLSLPEVDMSLTTRASSPSYLTESQAATVTSIMSSAASAASSALSFWRGWSRGSDSK